jgi:alcohol dehydrogenase
MTSDEHVQVGEEGAEVFIQKFLSLGRPDAPVFLIAGRPAYESSGAASFFSFLLADKRVVHFADFSANPKIEEFRRILGAFRESRAGLILTVGGGSAIDFGKLVNYFASRGIDTEAYLQGNRGGEDAAFFPHLAVPTTAGTGSEATHFAVLYNGFKKISVADKQLIPSHVWLNSAFTASMPLYQAASSGFDALAQAIESYWAVGSTLESRQDSAKALCLCLLHLEGAVLTPTSEHRAGMLEAAHLAGRAINVSKTTAAHAMSYALTAYYGLPHGHAVAMTLPAVFEANAVTTEADVNDLRGVAYVRAAMQELCMLLGADSPKKAAQRLQEIMVRIGLSDVWFSAHGFDPAEVRDHVMQEVNAERLANNPRRLDGDPMSQIVAHIR